MMIFVNRDASIMAFALRLGVATSVCFSLGLGLGLSGCDSGSQTVSAPGLKMSLYSASTGSDPFEDVAFMRLYATGEGVDSGAHAVVVPYTPGGGADLDSIPYSVDGAPRQLVIEGWAADESGQPGWLVSRGRTAPMVIEEGGVEQEVNIMFARVNAFTPVVSATTLAPQQLTSSRVGHAVTMTSEGEIVISGGAWPTSADALWWTGAGLANHVGPVEAIDEDTMTRTGRASLLLPRAWHSATPIGSGQIILAGGYGANGDATKSVEVYNPLSVRDGQPMSVAPLATARAGHTATMLDSATRTILFVGGDAAGTWELWDPTNGSQGVQPLADGNPRFHHTATIFYVAGRVEPAVLIAGGETGTDGQSPALPTALMFDSVMKSMTAVGNLMPGGARTSHAATLVGDRGFIYVIGGFVDGAHVGVTNAIDVFDVASLSFREDTASFQMRTARGGHSAVIGPNNTVIITGGAGAEPIGGPTVMLKSMDVIYEYVDAASGNLQVEVGSSYDPNGPGVVPYMPRERIGHRTVMLPSGMALVIGGATPQSGGPAFEPANDLLVYNPF